jgi:CelD/BcsL family acetyltransferase involved in cellulose biosynthesis
MQRRAARIRTNEAIRIETPEQLRAVAATWDDLWARSEVTTPTARAEPLAQWLEHFAPKTWFRALVVADGEKWLAAMPVVRTTVRRVLSAASLCGSTWIPRGALLLDAQADVEAVMDALVAAARDLPWQLLWLQPVALESAAWQAFRRAVARAGMACDADVEHETAVLEISHDWEACKASWAKKHRQKMRHSVRLADEAGVRFQVHSRLSPEEVGPWMQRALEIEDRSWKGDAGTSVQRRGEMEFLASQARQFAQEGRLELAFLDVRERPIAFAYGFRGKGVLHVCKIGYDPEYASMTPGQVLFYYLIEHLHADPDCRALDFFGKLTEALSRWRPTAVPIGRIAVAPRRLFGRLALYWYKRRKRRAKSTVQPSQSLTAQAGDAD